MHLRLLIIPMLLIVALHANAQNVTIDTLTATQNQFFAADNDKLQYTGRFDFSQPSLPHAWAPGVYMTANFIGSSFEAIIKDECLYGKNQNFLEVIIDHKPFRLQTPGKTNTVRINNLSGGKHTVTICKNTEAGIGYIAFAGVRCQQLLPPGAKPLRKIEFFGDSITCGTGSDESSEPCNTSDWYKQHNAYLSYGPTTARNLEAQYHISAVSGIGLVHSCCKMDIVMPDVYDKLDMRSNKYPWSFSAYQPNVVTICLGQNDGQQDSLKFCDAYINFLDTLRSHYPSAQIVCLTSPMADLQLTGVLQKYLTSIVTAINKRGDTKVSKYFFSRQYHKGCGGHPDLQEHQQIAGELTAYLRKLQNW